MYTYLLINIFTVFFPLVLSFDKKVYFFQFWKPLLLANLISGIVFLFWDHLFTVGNVWSFSNKHTVGLTIFSLPLEEVLFFLTVPFACIFIYECLNVYVKRDFFKKIAHSITFLLIPISILMAIIFRQQLYTLITFGLLNVLCTWAIIRKPVWLSRFYLGFLVSLIPFFIINGILTAIPVVMYNDAENIGIRIGSIPFEDAFYLLDLLLLNTFIFEGLKKQFNPAS